MRVLRDADVLGRTTVLDGEHNLRVMGGVISADIGMLSQKLPGDQVALTPITIERARREVEKLAEVQTLIEEWCLS